MPTSEEREVAIEEGRNKAVPKKNKNKKKKKHAVNLESPTANAQEIEEEPPTPTSSPSGRKVDTRRAAVASSRGSSSSDTEWANAAVKLENPTASAQEIEEELPTRRNRQPNKKTSAREEQKNQDS